MQKNRFTFAILVSVLMHIFVFSLLFINLPSKNETSADLGNVIKAVVIQNIPEKKSEPQENPSLPAKESEKLAEQIKNIENKTLISKKITQEKNKKPNETIQKDTKPLVSEELEIPEKLLNKIEQGKANKIKEEAKLKEKKLAEQKKKQEEVKKKAAEKKRREQAAKDLENELTKEHLNLLKQDEESNQVVDEEEIETVSKPVEKQMATEHQQLISAKHALGEQSEIDKYKELIKRAISNKWLMPKISDDTLTCKLLVHLGPGGVVVSIDVLKESGDVVLDQSAQAAIMKASPLPVPEDTELFDNFRSLRLTFRPQGIISG